MMRPRSGGGLLRRRVRLLNGKLDHVTIGYGETITYCQGEGPNTIVIRAVDTSGNASAFSNEIVFC